jgi:hypothetical protein
MYIYDNKMTRNFFRIYFSSCWINFALCKKVAVAEFCMLACQTRSGGKAISAILWTFGHSLLKYSSDYFFLRGEIGKQGTLFQTGVRCKKFIVLAVEIKHFQLRTILGCSRQFLQRPLHTSIPSSTSNFLEVWWNFCRQSLASLFVAQKCLTCIMETAEEL